MPVLYHLVTSTFEAACKISILQDEHQASKLHGHSYEVSLRIVTEQIPEKIHAHLSMLDYLSLELEKLSSQLDYSLLNDVIEVPTDENIARWFLSKFKLSQLKDTTINQIAIQSTKNSGVDLSPNKKGEFEAHIWRRYRFEAAHQLPNVEKGHQCGRMHGHGFEVILHLNQQLTNQDMGIDFDLIDQVWEPLNVQLHNRCLNHINGLENPTSEVLSHWIWQKIKPEIEALSWVTVYETHSSGCHYNGLDYRIWKEFLFESALKFESNLLGHSYKLRLHLTAELDQVMGWTVDYGDVKQLFKPIYEQLDHHQLDLSTGIKSPTVENLLYWIKYNLSTEIPALDRIDLYEKQGHGAQLCWGKEGPAIPD